MKHLLFRPTFFLLFSLTFTCLYGQEFDPVNKTKMISRMEGDARKVFLKPHETNLVDNYDLKYHRFQWLVDPAQLSIRGSVTSYYISEDPFMSTIQFELSQEMSADSAYHRGAKVAISHTGNLVTVNFGEIIAMGVMDSVTVYYHGTPPGTGFGSFAIGNHNGTPALWTLSEPYGASEWWPSKNDLADKIDSIDVFVATPNEYKVASNGILMGVAPYGQNLSVTWWKHKYPIVSYLIAIAVTNYAVYEEYYPGPGGSYPVVNYVYPEDSASCAIQTGKLMPVYELFGSLFGDYPFDKEKYGHAEFGWGGGMEHQTMTFIGQGAFNIAILSHELSHQWFGDLITCGSWQDIWLNEGFATYCTGLMYEHTSPNLYWPIWKYQNQTYVTYYPDGSVYCYDTTDVNRIFDSRLSYSKGAYILHQLRWVVGDSSFFAGVYNYISDPDLRFGFALTDDFREHMEAASGMDLTQYFSDWVYHEGYPSYHINCVQNEANNATLTMNQIQSHQSVSFFALPVPLKFFGEGRDTTVIVKNTFAGQVFTVNPGFRIDSIQFDPELWLITANNEIELGIEELPAGKTFTLSPVPCSDHLEAHHNLGVIRSAGFIDMAGKQYTANIRFNTPSKLGINTGELKNGVYMLWIETDQFHFSRKILVSR